MEPSIYSPRLKGSPTLLISAGVCSMKPKWVWPPGWLSVLAERARSAFVMRPSAQSWSRPWSGWPGFYPKEIMSNRLGYLILFCLIFAGPLLATASDGEVFELKVAKGDSLINICKKYLEDPEKWSEIFLTDVNK